MSLTYTSPPTLPLIPLPHQNQIILLPGLQISFPITHGLAQDLVKYLQGRNDDGGGILVGAVPVVRASERLFDWGCAARIQRVFRQPTSSTTKSFVITLQALTRIELSQPLPPLSLTSLIKSHPVTYHPNSPSDVPSEETLSQFRDAASNLLERHAQSGASDNPILKKVKTLVEELGGDDGKERAGLIVDVIIGAVGGEWDDRLAYLSTPSLTPRLTLASTILQKLLIQSRILKSVGDSISKQQKEIILRQQLRAIQKELGDGRDGEDGEEDDLKEILEKIGRMREGSEERKVGMREYKRLKKIPQGSVESGVIRTYLEWLTYLPWPSSSSPTPTPSPNPTTSPTFLQDARAQLDADHYGLDKIKRRLIEYLAVLRLKEQEIQAAKEVEVEMKAVELVGSSSSSPSEKNKPAKRVINKGPILLFVGPPGVGKTSLATSISQTLGKPFARVSLGGVRDEAEIRGHRRTYVASAPGKIVQALRGFGEGRCDGVMLLDEIDKVGHNNFHGDPSAALLEVLDPEQNHSFVDHYINVPVDLSQIIFIATANSLDTISAPLLDRCEVIRLSGYSYDEKMHIAKRFLLPKQLSQNSLPSSQLLITDPALLHIATHYTREAGVRNLEREIASVVRYKVVEWTSTSPPGGEGYNPLVDVGDLERILGVEKFDVEERERDGLGWERRGVVYGMVVMGEGEGGILSVESVAVPSSSGGGKLKLTGSLGDVIRESAEIALSWVRSNAYALGITNSKSEDPLRFPHAFDVHLHLPAGAQKKDGPSAGIAMVCALLSLLTGAVVPSSTAMTGEITLRGAVTAVGGIKEKLMGAHRAGVRKVIIPRRNRKDVDKDLLAVVGEMEIVFVGNVREAIDAAFGRGVMGWRNERRGGMLLESRL